MNWSENQDRKKVQNNGGNYTRWNRSCRQYRICWNAGDSVILQAGALWTFSQRSLGQVRKSQTNWFFQDTRWISFSCPSREILWNAKGSFQCNPLKSGTVCWFAAWRYGILATIIGPQENNVEKNAAMRPIGLHLIKNGEDFQAAREYAKIWHMKNHWKWYLRLILYLLNVSPPKVWNCWERTRILMLFTFP